MNASTQDLYQRAMQGDVRATATLGRRLLVGENVEPDLPDGIRILRLATERGDAEAPTLLAGLAAHGLLEARDSTKALDLLALGAERGWPPAQRQLRFLARAGGDDWAALRRRVDIVDLTKPPPRHPLSEDPRIRVFENFATPEECDRLVDLLRGMLKPALIYRSAVQYTREDVRTNTEAELTILTLDVVNSVLLERIAQAMGVSRSFCEVPKVMHYATGQEFQYHNDFFDVQRDRGEIEASGQRIATFLLYLNDDYDGGETAFPRAKIRYKGRKGDALLFANVGATGAPNANTEHAGLPPTRGQKWLLSQWVRGKALNAFMTPGADRETLDPNWLRKI